MDIIGLDRGRRVASAVAAQIGHDHPVPRRCQRRNLVTPSVGKTREAVQQDYRWARPGLVNRQPDTICANEPWGRDGRGLRRRGQDRQQNARAGSNQQCSTSESSHRSPRALDVLGVLSRLRRGRPVLHLTAGRLFGIGEEDGNILISVEDSQFACRESGVGAKVQRVRRCDQ